MSGIIYVRNECIFMYTHRWYIARQLMRKWKIMMTKKIFYQIFEERMKLWLKYGKVKPMIYSGPKSYHATSILIEMYLGEYTTHTLILFDLHIKTPSSGLFVQLCVLRGIQWKSKFNTNMKKEIDLKINKFRSENSVNHLSCRSKKYRSTWTRPALLKTEPDEICISLFENIKNRTKTEQIPKFAGMFHVSEDKFHVMP